MKQESDLKDMMSNKLMVDEKETSLGCHPMWSCQHLLNVRQSPSIYLIPTVSERMPLFAHLFHPAVGNERTVTV